MALKIGPCPKCGNTTFIATANRARNPNLAGGRRRRLYRSQI